MPEGRLWEQMRRQRRRVSADLMSADVPNSVGVYAWFRDGEPIYAGRAVARGGLRGRVWSKHLGTGLDLSRSSLRRNVLERLLDIPTSVSRQRPTVIAAAQAAAVNAWISECEVAWIEFDSVDEAKSFERALLGEWRPPLSKR